FVYPDSACASLYTLSLHDALPISLVSIYVLSLIIDALAPNFGGTKDPVKAFKVAAYSWTAAWIAGIFGVIPQLAILSIVGLYSLDRKSTRLNSSHVKISYAVFCLK